MTFWLKGCPRCRGDLIEEPGIGPFAGAASFLSCLQCGHVLTPEEESAIVEERRLRAAKVSVA